MMKAAVQTAYGPPEVVVIRDIPKPVPKGDEVLVRVVATTVTSGDSRLRAFRVPAAFWLPARLFMGLTRPRKTVLGSEFAGEIAAVGEAVTRFSIGDRVFGMHVYGAHAEFKLLPETAAILALPDDLDFGEAAALPFGALTALFFLTKAGLKAGERILINGASGAVGSFGVQLAHHFGAHVTAVTSGGNAALVRSLGADSVLDYTVSDVSRSGERYDVVMDMVDTISVAQFRRIATKNARLLAVNAGGGMFLRAGLARLFAGPRIIVGMATETLQDLETIRNLVVSGAIRPTIGQRFALVDIVRAHALVDSGRKRGAVVVEVAQAAGTIRSPGT